MKNDLKHLRRSELIDLIYEMKKREIELQTRLDEAEAKLQAREITIEKAGSIADAAVQLSGVFQAAQEAADTYLKSVYQRTLRGTIAVLLVVAAISVLVATLWMPVLQIYGSSMSPTLEAGQIVVSVKTNQLKTGEVVAFWQGNKLLIKRVIAGPGQWVDIDMDGNVTVDGQTLDEPYLTEKALGNCDIDLPHQVSEAHWFLMGDNRDTSVDSRSTAIGDISKDQIEGQIIFRIWPLNKIGSIQ